MSLRRLYRRRTFYGKWRNGPGQPTAAYMEGYNRGYQDERLVHIIRNVINLKYLNKNQTLKLGPEETSGAQK